MRVERDQSDEMKRSARQAAASKLTFSRNIRLQSACTHNQTAEKYGCMHRKCSMAKRDTFDEMHKRSNSPVCCVNDRVVRSTAGV
jgi:hypothetical protein